MLDHPLATRVLSDGAGLAQVPEQLGDEEGIAVGLPEERVGQSEALFAQCMAGRGLHEGLHAVLVEALELEAGEATVSPSNPSVSRRPGDWASSLSRNVPSTRRRTGCSAATRCRSNKRLALSRPLQVVEHEHDRLLLGDRAQEADSCCEEEVALRVRVRGL